MTMTPLATYSVFSTGSNTTTLTTPSFTPATNEIIVIKGCIENSNSGNRYTTPTATGGGITWTKGPENVVANTCYAVIWYGKVTSGGSAITVSLGGQTVGGWHSMLVERWPTTALIAGTPATNATKTGTGAPSATLTTVANGSVISWANGDWAAVDPVNPSGHTYRSSATEEALHDKSPTTYVAYYAYQQAATAGSQTIGLSVPTGQTWAMLGIEIQDTSSGATSSATYTGAGTFTSANVQQYVTTAPETGTGTFTNAVIQKYSDATGDFGTGTFTASAVQSYQPNAAVTGTGSFTATIASQTGSLTVPFSGTGSFAAGIAAQTAILNALPSGTGTFSSTLSAQNQVGVTAPFSGTGSFVNAVVQQYVTAMASTGSGTFSSANVQKYSANATPNGTGTFSASVAAQTYSATAAFSGSGTFVALVGNSQLAPFTGTGAFSVTITQQYATTVGYSGSGTLTSSNVQKYAQSINVTGVGTFTPTAVQQYNSAVPFSGTGSFSATIVTGNVIPAPFAGSGTFSTIVSAQRYNVTAPFSGTGVFIASIAQSGAFVIGVWDGTQILNATILGVWDGTQILPASILEIT